jgi:hypothetical protein
MAITEKLQLLADDRELLDRMSVAASERIRSIASSEETGRKLVETLREALHNLRK